jgi:hypothetical protein
MIGARLIKQKSYGADIWFDSRPHAVGFVDWLVLPTPETHYNCILQSMKI